MYSNTGYFNAAETDLVTLTVPLRVNSCGIYRLITRSSMSTIRPEGRPDYQLLYIASGRAWFTFDKEEVEIPAGTMVLYRPYERQQYSYYIEDKPEVYWIHVTGSQAEQHFGDAGLGDGHKFAVGQVAEYQELFLRMIRELQLMRPCFMDLLPLLFSQLLVLVGRHIAEGNDEKRRASKDIESAIHYFNEHFSEEIQISEYAKSRHMSTCWFIRSFKEYMGVPPLQYLTSIRIDRAKELLKSTGYTVGEIGEIVGYENSLYFSRIFKKNVGTAPVSYRKIQ